MDSDRYHVAERPQFQYLYLHTKGVSHLVAKQSVTDWTDMMLHFLVEKHVMCGHLLASGAYDAIGVNYKSGFITAKSSKTGTAASQPEYRGGVSPHFAGNFWWTTGDHLSRLEELQYNQYKGLNRLRAEMWLLNTTTTATVSPLNIPAEAGQTTTSQNKEVRVFCPHFSPVDHYTTEYPRHMYA